MGAEDNNVEALHKDIEQIRQIEARMEPRREIRQYDESMAGPTREEIDAKLETIEAKMDGRVATITGKIDALIERIDGMNAKSELRQNHIEANTKGVKETIIATGGVVVAVVVAVIALAAAVFESGKGFGTAVEQVKASAAASTAPAPAKK
jgi:hypothetical protein